MAVGGRLAAQLRGIGHAGAIRVGRGIGRNGAFVLGIGAEAVGRGIEHLGRIVQLARLFRADAADRRVALAAAGQREGCATGNGAGGWRASG